jgi:UDP-glucose:(heptosyl)LPS alpha-1,3-glucosyltransferase
MKLALIRRHYSATGGAELYLRRLMTALAQQGHELHLFTEAWPAEGTPAQLRLQPVAGPRAWRPLKFAAQVAAALETEPFDCVFSLERTLRQDVYRAGDGVHAAWLEQRRRYTPWWRRWLIGWGAFHRHMRSLEAQVFDPEHTGRIIVNSEMVRAEIRRRFGFPDERMHLVRNGIELDRFAGGNREEARRKLGFRAGETVLLFVGSGWERKGMRFLVQAYTALKTTPPGESQGWRLLVVGKGRAAQLPPDAIHAGPMLKVEEAFAAADLFAFLPIYEPSANVVCEALAAGLPVITTAANGGAEWLDPERTGTVINEPEDTAAVVAALRHWRGRRAVLTPKERAAMALERNVAETTQVLELAAASRPKPGPSGGWS